MASECFLSCPEFFEGLDTKYGTFGPFGDTGIDSDTPFEELDPQLVADYKAYEAHRQEVFDYCNENWTTCIGPQLLYDIKTRLPFLICPITTNPYHMPLSSE